ncbi:MAG TPA: MFS transporter [Micromonosporaceae bacterium]|jgi:EmrB/QacA subfamily drug resistance transporter
MSASRWAAIGVLVFASFIDLIDGSIVNVALPAMRADLPASPAQLEWIVSGYLLAFAVLLVTGGRLGDLFGRRRVFIVGVAGFTLASLAAAVAPGAQPLIATRLAQGAFAAMMSPQLLSSIQVLFRPKERPAVFGLVGAVTGLAAVVGPVLGGWLVTANYFDLSWRAIFAINVPIGVAIIVAAIRLVPETTSDRPPRLDLPGVALATIGIFAVTFALVEGRDRHWAAWIWELLAGGLLTLTLFAVYGVRRERRDGAALLPMHLFRNRGYTAGLATQALFQGSLAAFVLTFTLYVQNGLGFSAIGAGLTMLPFSLGAILGTAVSVPLGTRLGKVIMFVGALAQAASVVWAVAVVRHVGPALSGWDLAPALLLGGIGLGLLVVPLIDVALATVAASDAGAASGAYGTLQQVGAALGVAVVGVVFFGTVGADFSQPTLQHGFTTASWVAVTGYGLCALATLLLPSRTAVRAHAVERERALALD